MNNIKIGEILIDDCNLLYKVIEVFKNSAVVEQFPNKGDIASEIMSFSAMEHEGWKIVNLVNLNN